MCQKGGGGVSYTPGCGFMGEDGVDVRPGEVGLGVGAGLKAREQHLIGRDPVSLQVGNLLRPCRPHVVRAHDRMLDGVADHIRKRTLKPPATAQTPKENLKHLPLRPFRDSEDFGSLSGAEEHHGHMTSKN